MDWAWQAGEVAEMDRALVTIANMTAALEHLGQNDIDPDHNDADLHSRLVSKIDDCIRQHNRLNWQ